MSGNICKSITHNLASYSRVGVCSSARSELLKTSVEFEALGASVKWKHFPTVCLNLFKHSKPRVKVSNNVFYSEEVESKSMETINKPFFSTLHVPNDSFSYLFKVKAQSRNKCWAKGKDYCFSISVPQSSLTVRQWEWRQWRVCVCVWECLPEGPEWVDTPTLCGQFPCSTATLYFW